MLLPIKNETNAINIGDTPKSQKPLNPLKGTLKSFLNFNEFPFRG